jgi:uncharacterized OB-fold protein
MTTRISKPPPPQFFQFAADVWTQPYWDAAKEHRLTACQCGACGRFRMPPSPFCPNCRSQAVEWPTLSGRGAIFSYTVVERAVVPEMAEHLPYVPALIELPDALGVRLISNIVGAPLDQIHIGAEVHAVWEDRADGVSLVRFALGSASSSSRPNGVQS